MSWCRSASLHLRKCPQAGPLVLRACGARRKSSSVILLSTSGCSVATSTRLAKLDRGDYDAIVLAVAGLKRLGLEARATARLSADEMLPARAGRARHRVPRRARGGRGVARAACRRLDYGLRACRARREPRARRQLRLPLAACSSEHGQRAATRAGCLADGRRVVRCESKATLPIRSLWASAPRRSCAAKARARFLASRELAGRGILVTRPGERAGNLVRMIEALGGRAHVFPAIEIEDLPARARWRSSSVSTSRFSSARPRWRR